MKLKNITPEKFKCVAASCPAVYSSEESEKIVIVGDAVDLEELGLIEKVGDDEVAVMVDSEMLEQADLAD